jgi:DNA-binding winged helix-turn-helix (wHTH) protein
VLPTVEDGCKLTAVPKSPPMSAPETVRTVRFDAFELDLEAGELRRSGIRLPVHGRPLQLLAVLLRAPGQLVSTEDLRMELWAADTFVDFDHGVRNAIARLRAVLGDAADRPRFIETVPRRGYRFIGAVAESLAQPAPALPSGPPAAQRNLRRRLAVAVILASLVCVAGAGAWLYSRSHGSPSDVHIKSLAVLPLVNFSGDAAQDHFTDGVTDELITALAKIDSVKVISRTSVMQY